MDNNEIVIVENQQYLVSQIPNIIKEEITSLNDVKKRNEEAKIKADDAKKKAENLKPYRFFKQKAAVEDIQEAVSELADAQEAITDAQNTSFEYQQKLSKTYRFLMMMGMANRAANRSIVREVRLSLSNASQEEIDDLAKEELERVIKELNEQEDMARKQERLFDILEENEFLLDKHERGLNYVNKRLIGVKDKENEFEKAILKNEESIAKNTSRIFETEKIEREHEERIIAGERKDKVHDHLIKNQQEIDKIHEKELQIGKNKDTEHDEEIKFLKDKLVILENNNKELIEDVANLEQCILNQNNTIRELNLKIINYDKLARSMSRKKWTNRVKK